MQFIEFFLLLLFKVLYDFIESHDLSPLDEDAEIVVVNTYPRKELASRTVTITEAGLYPSASVIVEELDEE